MSENNFYEAAKGFVYRNARPLDFALFCYHFEQEAHRRSYVS